MFLIIFLAFNIDLNILENFLSMASTDNCNSMNFLIFNFLPKQSVMKLLAKCYIQKRKCLYTAYGPLQVLTPAHRP